MLDGQGNFRTFWSTSIDPSSPQSAFEFDVRDGIMISYDFNRNAEVKHGVFCISR
jgi:hypothetical protein